MPAAILFGLALAAAGGATAGRPAEAWECTSEVEVWCDGTSCRARPLEETTPLSIHADEAGAFSVCAYSGCWEGKGEIYRHRGRVLLTAENVPFSSGNAGSATSITLLIGTQDGTGFVRAGGLATPLICKARRG